VYVIMDKAVPAFINTFDDLGAELPPITVGLIAVSNFTTKYGKYVAAGILALIAALWLYSRTEKGGLLFSRLRLSLPVLGEIGRMAGASQFAHTMSAMLAAGVPILQAIAVSSRAMSSLIMAQEGLGTLAGGGGGGCVCPCPRSLRRRSPRRLDDFSAEQIDCLPLNAGDLDLRNPYDCRRLRLRHVMLVSQRNHLTLPLRKISKRLLETKTQRDAILYAIVSQQLP